MKCVKNTQNNSVIWEEATVLKVTENIPINMTTRNMKEIVKNMKMEDLPIKKDTDIMMHRQEMIKKMMVLIIKGGEILRRGLKILETVIIKLSTRLIIIRVMGINLMRIIESIMIKKIIVRIISGSHMNSMRSNTKSTQMSSTSNKKSILIFYNSKVK